LVLTTDSAEFLVLILLKSIWAGGWLNYAADTLCSSVPRWSALEVVSTQHKVWISVQSARLSWKGIESYSNSYCSYTNSYWCYNGNESSFAFTGLPFFRGILFLPHDFWTVNLVVGLSLPLPAFHSQCPLLPDLNSVYWR